MEIVYGLSSSLLVFITAYIFFKLGLKVATKPQETAESPILPKTKRKHKLTEEELEMQRLIKEIDDYTGVM